MPPCCCWTWLLLCCCWACAAARTSCGLGTPLAGPPAFWGCESREELEDEAWAFAVTGEGVFSSEGDGLRAEVEAFALGLIWFCCGKKLTIDQQNILIITLTHIHIPNHPLRCPEISSHWPTPEQPSTPYAYSSASPPGDSSHPDSAVVTSRHSSPPHSHSLDALPAPIGVWQSSGLVGDRTLQQAIPEAQAQHRRQGSEALRGRVWVRWRRSRWLG